MADSNTWSKESGFIWSMIGSAVGFANILSFSALCYRNGGGAFLIPYVLAHIVVGFPLLLLEGVIGQKNHLPYVTALGACGGRPAKTVGWLSVLTCATIGGFYIVLTGFAVAYTYFSASGSIGADSAYFFKHTFLQDSGAITTMGKLAGGVLLGTVVVAVLAWAVLMRNIQSGLEKLCSVFLPLLGVLIVVFTVATFWLPGSLQGMQNYLTPHFGALKNPLLWRDVFGQVFFSLSVGLGIVTGYARHNKESFCIKRAMIKVAIGDFLISFVSGLAIFGCIGFMSAKVGRPFSSLVPSDSAFEIGFVVFPMILAQFGVIASRVVGPLFFLCVFIAGITGVFSIVESVAGNIEVEFQKSRKKAVALSMGLISLLALPFCMGNGQHIIGAISPGLGNSMLIGGIAEIITFLLLSKAVANDPAWFTGKKRSYPYHVLRGFVLPLLVLSLGAAIVKEFSAPITVEVVVRWSWFTLIALSAFVLARRPTPATAFA